MSSSEKLTEGTKCHGTEELSQKSELSDTREATYTGKMLVSLDDQDRVQARGQTNQVDKRPESHDHSQGGTSSEMWLCATTWEGPSLLFSSAKAQKVPVSYLVSDTMDNTHCVEFQFQL